MPTTKKYTLKKFLLDLVEKPSRVKQLKTNPKAFISKSALSKSHKQILVSGHAKKIKSIIAEAVGGPDAVIKIMIKIPPVADTTAALPEAIHIVFGVAESQAKVSIEPQASKEGPAGTEVVARIKVTENKA